MFRRLVKLVPGYGLAAVLTARDPLTGEPVRRDARNLIGGFIGLIPGGALLFSALSKSGSIESDHDWVDGSSESDE